MLHDEAGWLGLGGEFRADAHNDGGGWRRRLRRRRAGTVGSASHGGYRRSRQPVYTANEREASRGGLAAERRPKAARGRASSGFRGCGAPSGHYVPLYYPLTEDRSNTITLSIQASRSSNDRCNYAVQPEDGRNTPRRGPDHLATHFSRNALVPSSHRTYSLRKQD